MIPGDCLLCGNPTVSLHWHHWTEDGVIRASQICSSCNTRLGIIFGKDYPNWETQIREIREFFIEANEESLRNSTPGLYPRVPEGGVPCLDSSIPENKEFLDWLEKKDKIRGLSVEDVERYKRDNLIETRRTVKDTPESWMVEASKLRRRISRAQGFGIVPEEDIVKLQNILLELRQELLVIICQNKKAHKS